RRPSVDWVRGRETRAQPGHQRTVGQINLLGLLVASYNSPHMETATAATSASQERGAADRQSAALRLRELAANLGVHRGFSDVVASLEAGHGGTLGGGWGSSRARVA